MNAQRPACSGCRSRDKRIVELEELLREIDTLATVHCEPKDNDVAIKGIQAVITRSQSVPKVSATKPNDMAIHLTHAIKETLPDGEND